MRNSKLSAFVMILIIIFCVLATAVITEYLASSFCEVEIKRLSAEVADLKSKLTPEDVPFPLPHDVSPGINEKNAFYLGYIFGMASVMNLSEAMVNEFGIDRDADRTSDLWREFSEFESEMNVRASSLGIDFAIPMKYDDRYLVNTESVKQYRDSLIAELQRQIRIRHTERTYETFLLGLELGHTYSCIHLMKSIGVFDTESGRKELRKRIESALERAEQLTLDDKLFNDLRDYAKKRTLGSAEDFAKAIEPLQKYYW